MFKPQMRFQKILYIVLLILSAGLFLYAIGLCTDLYPLYLSKALELVDGADFYDDIQGYNAQLVKFSIVIIIASVIPFIFSSNTRRKYYLDNFISNGVQVAIYIACSIYLFINTAKYKALYFEKVDIEAYIEYCEKKQHFFSGTTIWFDLGYVFGAIFIVSCIAIVLNCIWKVKLVNNENKLLNEGGKK